MSWVAHHRTVLITHTRSSVEYTHACKGRWGWGHPWTRLQEVTILSLLLSLLLAEGGGAVQTGKASWETAISE
jgi:hypothetical protein